MNLILSRVSRWYGNVVAVNDISFALRPGITGLLGPNGAGKTTLLHLAAGLLRPSAGKVEIDGVATWGHPEVYRKLGFVPESEVTWGFLTGVEFVRLNARLYGIAGLDAAIRDALATVELEAAQDRRIVTYSKGMRQRIKVAATLVHQPQVLLLDEPFNGLDPRQRLQMMELLKRLAGEGRTVLVSSHILEEIDQLADNILVVVGGRLAASGERQIIRRLMTDRPDLVNLRSTDDRKLAALLLLDPATIGVELSAQGITLRTNDLGSLSHLLPRLAREQQIGIRQVRAADQSLESIFAYLVDR